MSTPTEATYQFAYPLGITPPSGSTTYPLAQSFESTITDDQDGDENGEVTVGSNMSWTGGTVVELVGITNRGEPIIRDPDVGGGFYSVLSNDGGLVGQTLVFSGSGTYVMCFAKGTLISTPTGACPVETLEIGTHVLTQGGQAVAVKWVGRRTLHTRFGPAERLMPVRFAAGSLGDGVPHAELTVTADHAMLVDGVLCNAGALVNGTTITRVPLAEMGETFTVYHVETEAHEIILANGAPAETFIDSVGRRMFDNYADFEALYGDVPDMEELPLPRAVTARQVPARIQAKLAESGRARIA